MPSPFFAIKQAAEARAEKLRQKGKLVDMDVLIRMEPDKGTTNIRNLNLPHWRKWFGVQSRCIVPVTSFAEPDPVSKQDGGSTPNAWCSAGHIRFDYDEFGMTEFIPGAILCRAHSLKREISVNLGLKARHNSNALNHRAQNGPEVAISMRSGRVDFVEHGQRTVMLSIDVHPRSLHFVQFDATQPKEPDCAPKTRRVHLFGAVQMLPHSTTEILSQPNIENILIESG
jgi:hypothetical protein